MEEDKEVDERPSTSFHGGKSTSNLLMEVGESFHGSKFTSVYFQFAFIYFHESWWKFPWK